jgi:hypothetical protein
MVDLKKERKRERKMNFGAVITGRYIFAVRKDDRWFAGCIWNVRAMPKGTLVTITVADEEKQSGFGYRNVYLEDCTDWAVYENAEELNMVVC